MTEREMARHQYRKLRRKVGNELLISHNLVNYGPRLIAGGRQIDWDVDSEYVWLGGAFTATDLRLLADWMEADHSLAVSGAEEVEQ